MRPITSDSCCFPSRSFQCSPLSPPTPSPARPVSALPWIASASDSRKRPRLASSMWPHRMLQPRGHAPPALHDTFRSPALHVGSVAAAGGAAGSGKPPRWWLRCALILTCCWHWPPFICVADGGSLLPSTVWAEEAIVMSVVIIKPSDHGRHRRGSIHWHRGHEGGRAQRRAAAAQFRHIRAQKAKLVRRLTEARTAREGAEQEPQ
jgi:hypothetical protein